MDTMASTSTNDLATGRPASVLTIGVLTTGALVGALHAGRPEQVLTLVKGMRLDITEYAAIAYPYGPDADRDVVAWWPRRTDVDMLAALRARGPEWNGPALYMRWRLAHPVRTAGGHVRPFESASAAHSSRRLERALGAHGASWVVASLARGLWDDLEHQDRCRHAVTVEPRGWRALHDSGNVVHIGPRWSGGDCRHDLRRMVAAVAAGAAPVCAGASCACAYWGAGGHAGVLLSRRAV